MQEWFQHPAKISSRDSGHSDSAVLNPLPAGVDIGELSQRHSFGFGQIDQDDCTSSDGEPGKFIKDLSSEGFPLQCSCRDLYIELIKSWWTSRGYLLQLERKLAFAAQKSSS